MTDQTDQIAADREPSRDDIRFLADRADSQQLQDKGEALMVLLTALSSATSRSDQHHHREREELLASIRR